MAVPEGCTCYCHGKDTRQKPNEGVYRTAIVCRCCDERICPLHYLKEDARPTPTFAMNPDRVDRADGPWVTFKHSPE